MAAWFEKERKWPFCEDSDEDPDPWFSTAAEEEQDSDHENEDLDDESLPSTPCARSNLSSLATVVDPTPERDEFEKASDPRSDAVQSGSMVQVQAPPAVTTNDASFVEAPQVNMQATQKSTPTMPSNLMAFLQGAAFNPSVDKERSKLCSSPIFASPDSFQLSQQPSVNSIGQFGSFSNETVSVKQSFCRCGTTKCLKMYCACFARNTFCSAQCQCGDNCKNNKNPENTEDRMKAIKNVQLTGHATKRERAMKSFETSPHAITANICTCKKSRCTKKYCVCFAIGRACNENCKCVNCENMPGCI